MLLPDWNTKPVRAIRYGVALLLLAYLLCLPRRLFDVPYATVVTDRHGELLGAHLVGEESSVLIQPLLQAMSFGMDARTLARGQYWIHPALTEIVENALLGLEFNEPAN